MIIDLGIFGYTIYSNSISVAAEYTYIKLLLLKLVKIIKQFGKGILSSST